MQRFERARGVKKSPDKASQVNASNIRAFFLLVNSQWFRNFKVEAEIGRTLEILVVENGSDMGIFVATPGSIDYGGKCST